MSEIDPTTVILAMPGSDRIANTETDCHRDLMARMVERNPLPSDPGMVTITEAFEGPIFSVWREGRMVCSSSAWLSSAPETRNRLSRLLPTEDVELTVGRPHDYEGYSPDEDLFLLELRVDGQRRPWIEMASAAKLTERLHLEPVFWRDRTGLSTEEAIRAIGMGGAMGYKKDPRRIMYWLDIGSGAHAQNVAAAMYSRPLPKMTYKEIWFYRRMGILLRFNDADTGMAQVIPISSRKHSAPDSMGRIDDVGKKMTPRQKRLAAMKAAQVGLPGV